MTDVPPPAAPSREAGTPRRQTILVVDDEPGVRVIVARMLTLSGYSVVSAQSGEDAISIARDHAEAIDLPPDRSSLRNSESSALGSR